MLLSCAEKEVRINKAEPVCARRSLSIRMLSTGTLFPLTPLSQRAYCVRERKREKQRKGKKRERVKAIMHEAGTNGSYQKMRLEWLARLKVVTFI